MIGFVHTQQDNNEDRIKAWRLRKDGYMWAPAVYMVEAYKKNPFVVLYEYIKGLLKL